MPADCFLYSHPVTSPPKMPPLNLIEQHLVTMLLSTEAQAQYELGDIAKRELKPYVDLLRNISTAYVSHESGNKLASPIDSRLAAAAYALYYTPINAAKLLYLIPRIICPNRPLRVLDFGSGPGTAGLALLAALDNPISLICIESSSCMRAIARQLLSPFSSEGLANSALIAPKLYELIIQESLDSLNEGSLDLVIAANVFAELQEGAAKETLTKLARLVSDSGSLLLLEPGQQKHTRRLMALRDYLIESDATLTPVFPCLRNDPCPMLKASESDWCHGTIEWNQPPLSRQLDDLLGFNKHRIKYSSFIFQRGASVAPGFRVLTPPIKTRAGIEALLCGKDLFGIGRVPKGMRSEKTRAFERAKVYDCVDHPKSSS
jgi:ribosomal protein RSM22 (predicted rRNA methylase)